MTAWEGRHSAGPISGTATCRPASSIRQQQHCDLFYSNAGAEGVYRCASDKSLTKDTGTSALRGFLQVRTGNGALDCLRWIVRRLRLTLRACHPLTIMPRA